MFLLHPVKNVMETQPAEKNHQAVIEGAYTTLGKKLENPHSVANMKRAATQLTNARSVSPVTGSHYRHAGM